MINTRNKNYIINFGLLIISALILMGAAFYNRFPITHFGDTALYMMYGFTKTHPAGTHSFMYGLFINYSSLHYSLWFVIFVQCFILAYIIIQSVYNYTTYNLTQSGIVSLLSVLAMGFCTSILKHSGSIMPDIYTSICFLSAVLLLLGPKLNTINKCIISIILILSIMFHTSHLVTMLAFFLTVLLLYMFFKKRFLVITKHRLILTLIIILIPILMIPLIHKAYTGSFYLSKSGQTILLGRLSEVGILNDFLANNCKSKQYTLCDYQGTFTDGWTFHWDQAKSPLYKNGDQFSAWENSRQEYKSMVIDILTTPKYLLWFIYESLKGSLSQILYYTYWTDSKRMDWIAAEIGKNLPADLQQYENCLQVKSWFYYEFDVPIAARNGLVYFYASFILLALFFINFLYQIISQLKFSLLVSFFVFIFSNAIVCAAFAGVYPRYQDRVLWLFPFIIILLIADWLQLIKSKSFFKKYEIR